MRTKIAVFIDQNGTLFDESNGEYAPVTHESFFPGTIQSLQKLYGAGVLLFIVTNQSSVGLGLIKREDAVRFNEEIRCVLADAGVGIQETFSCMHTRADKCFCRKPQPYFLVQTGEKYGINLADSFVIGDHPHDMEFADNAGATGLYVLTGHGTKHCGELTKSYRIFQNASDALEHIYQTRIFYESV
ncbi:MAG TPA: HAD-IIIA family hydrolase [Chitinispirillaceae bacterium]|nr:HAD-IIIA family hydrolase [Chitinispirillaceae bacterium]